jgi:glutathione S-transferase
MILRTSAGSPFGRKIKMALAVIGMTAKVEIVRADTSDENDNLRLQNPLGKIPILLQDDGEAIYDSRVILDHLDALDGRGILIPKGAARTRVLTHQALADGIMDAAILIVYESRFRTDTEHSPKWLAYQQAKIDRSLAQAEKAHTTPVTGSPNVGEITQAIALGYLDFRFKGEWRTKYPKLLAWHNDFVQHVPSFNETLPPV